jgi:hypothetical protein
VGDTRYIDVGEPEVEHKLTYDFDLATSSSGPRELSFTLRCLRRSARCTLMRPARTERAASLWFKEGVGRPSPKENYPDGQ